MSRTSSSSEPYAEHLQASVMKLLMIPTRRDLQHDDQQYRNVPLRKMAR